MQNELLIQVIGLPQEEQVKLMQLAINHEVYLFALMDEHKATAVAGVFAGEKNKYAGTRRMRSMGYFPLQGVLAVRALRDGSSIIHQWHAVDPEVGEGTEFSGYFYHMDAPQTIGAKDVMCKQSHIDKIRQEAAPSATPVQDETPAAPAPAIPETDGEQPRMGTQTGAPDLPRLFDSVGHAALNVMFPGAGDWKALAEKASTNELKVAKTSRAMFNPYLAAEWWLRKQKPAGWDWAKCLRKLANNLPARSVHLKYLLVDESRGF